MYELINYCIIVQNCQKVNIQPPGASVNSYQPAEAPLSTACENVSDWLQIVGYSHAILEQLKLTFIGGFL